MVSYSEWTSIVFEVAPDSADATEVISWAAARWRERKSDLEDASQREARNWADRQL